MSSDKQIEWVPPWSRRGSHYFFKISDIPEEIGGYICKFPNEHVKIDNSGNIIIVSFVHPLDLNDA